MSAAAAALPHPRPETAARAERILVFDSGLGGLTVFSAIRAARPAADYLYVADDAGFPYGPREEADLVARVIDVLGRLIPRYAPDLVVIACNTASVSVLPPLRSRYPAVPFVGTVPAIKPAAAASRSRRISVLATPGTVARVYTHDLVRAFAADCDVDLVGAPRLASLCEAALRGRPVAEAEISAEIAPAFVDRGGRRTDTVVLACTHYPLLRAELERLAPWPVSFVDPAPAIARRVETVLSELAVPRPAGPARPATALFTSNAAPGPELDQGLALRGLERFARF